MSWLLAVLLKPLGAFLIFGCVAFPIRYVLHKYLKDGKLKRLLLSDLYQSPVSSSNGKLWREFSSKGSGVADPVARLHK